MEAIKLLGTNGGSFYGVGGAHPFENPTGFTNMFDLLLVIVLPFAIAFMFGRLIDNRRQAYAIVAVMGLLFLGHTVISMQAEVHGNQLLPPGVSQVVSASSPGGNMEGKELRFGPDGSGLMTVGTMGTTAGATDSALDSYTPVGGSGAFVGILLGEVSPGGDGGGMYAMLVFAILAVFVAGLMGEPGRDCGLLYATPDGRADTSATGIVERRSTCSRTPLPSTARTPRVRGPFKTMVSARQRLASSSTTRPILSRRAYRSPPLASTPAVCNERTARLTSASASAVVSIIENPTTVGCSTTWRTRAVTSPVLARSLTWASRHSPSRSLSSASSTRIGDGVLARYDLPSESIVLSSSS